MTAEEITKLVLTLIGDIKPICDSHHDKLSNENLNKLIGITKSLHLQIDNILGCTQHSKFDSIKKAHDLCDEYYDWLGVPND